MVGQCSKVVDTRHHLIVTHEICGLAGAMSGKGDYATRGYNKGAQEKENEGRKDGEAETAISLSVCPGRS